MPEMHTHDLDLGHRERRPSTSRERAIHDPRQITSQEQLEVGKKYIMQHVERSERGEEGFLIQILSAPEKGWVRIRTLFKGAKPYESEISLADHGVLTYDSGYWNIVNYLVPATEESS